MTAKYKNKSPSRENQRLAKLITDRVILDLHAAELRNEIFQLKKALRITQKRIRHVSDRIKRENQERPMLTLVSSHDEVS